MTSSTTGSLSTRTIVLVLIASLTLLLALAFLIGGDDTDTDVDVLALPAASFEGDALPRFDREAAADPAIGLAPPRFSGPSVVGAEVDYPTSDDPAILLFLAHWCSFCRQEVPEVQSWLDAGGLDGSRVDLIAVATGIDPAQPNFPPDAWLAREGWTVPTLVDNDGTVADAFGLSAFPYWVVVADGEVVARFSGNVGADGLDRLVAELEPAG